MVVVKGGGVFSQTDVEMSVLTQICYEIRAA